VTTNTQAASTQPVQLSGTGLAEIIGTNLALPVGQLRALAQQARTHPVWSEARLAALDDAVEAAHRLSVQSQQLARLTGGRLRQSHERLPLHAILLDLLLQRQAAFKRQEIAVRQQLAPVEVIVDPGLLVGLLESLIDWAAQMGGEVQVKLGMKNWPEHGLLTVRATGPLAPHLGPGTAHPENLAWLLVERTAQEMGVAVKQASTPDAFEATLEFPRTVRQLSGLTALDTDRNAGADSSHVDWQASLLTGLRVLLVSDDMRVQREVSALSRQLDMNLEATSSAREAFDISELSQPALIIIDGSLRDEFFDDYLRRLARERANFHAVEIVEGDTGFEMSSWENSAMSRISRGALKEQLKTVLASEFGR
jgi:CheY-like chemotaxis protein